MFDRLAFRNYRCFRDWQDLRLGQLSLLYGPNNAGKSAIARLIPWIASSRRPGSYGLDVTFTGLRDAGYRDVAWRGGQVDDARCGWWDPGNDAPDGVAFAVQLGPVCATWHTGWRDTGAVVHRVAVARPEGRWEADLKWSNDVLRPPYRYRVGESRPLVTFDGILPRGEPAFNALAAALDTVVWLGSLRLGPTRGGVGRGVVFPMGEDGAGAQSIALSDDALLARVSAWYRANTNHDVSKSTLTSDADRLVLQQVAPPGPDVAFPDAGEGLQQVFPIVVALERLRAGPGLLIVEEPESHLHPSLQVAVATLTASVLQANPMAQVVFETHSEVLLVSAMQASLSGVDVQLHWVSNVQGAATVEEVNLANGRPLSDQLDRAFDTMGVLRRKLIERRRQHAG